MTRTVFGKRFAVGQLVITRGAYEVPQDEVWYEAYSKQMVLKKLGISQKFWNKMIAEGLPYTTVGHTRWVTGLALIEHLSRNAERKNS